MNKYPTKLAIIFEGPSEPMVGESVFDGEGNHIGWIADAVERPDEPDTLKLHDRMNAALLDYESAMGIEGGNGANTVPLVIEMHQIIEDAAKAGVGTCQGEIDTDYFECKLTWFECNGCGWRGVVDNICVGYSFDGTDMPRYCPNCGKRIEDEAE